MRGAHLPHQLQLLKLLLLHLLHLVLCLPLLLGQLTRCLGCCLGRAELLAMLPLGLFLNRRAAVRSAAEGNLKR